MRSLRARDHRVVAGRLELGPRRVGGVARRERADAHAMHRALLGRRRLAIKEKSLLLELAHQGLRAVAVGERRHLHDEVACRGGVLRRWRRLRVGLGRVAGAAGVGGAGAGGTGLASVAGGGALFARASSLFPGTAPLSGVSGLTNFPLSIGGIWIETSSPSGLGSLSSSSGSRTAAVSARTIAPTSRRRARRLSSSTAMSGASERVAIRRSAAAKAPPRR